MAGAEVWGADRAREGTDGRPPRGVRIRDMAEADVNGVSAVRVRGRQTA